MALISNAKGRKEITESGYYRLFNNDNDIQNKEVALLIAKLSSMIQASTISNGLHLEKSLGYEKYNKNKLIKIKIRQIKIIIKNSFFKIYMLFFSKLKEISKIRQKKNDKTEIFLNLLKKNNQNFKDSNINLKKKFFIRIKELIYLENHVKISKFVVLKTLILKNKLILRKYWNYFKEYSTFI